MDRVTMMRAFVAVAQDGSFTLAGKRLSLSTKLMSKYVRQLEEVMNVQLLHRTTRSVALTDIGVTCLERCRSILDQLDELDDLVLDRQSNLTGMIRITAPTGYGALRLTEDLAPFLRDHPDVQIDLRLSDNHVSLVDEGLDLAIRVGKLRDSSFIARKLSDMPVVLCASRDYLEKRGMPQNPGDLEAHNCLVNRTTQEPQLWSFSKDGETSEIWVNGTVQSESPHALTRLAVDGLGLVRAPLYQVRDHLLSGELQHVLPDYETLVYGLYVLYPPNRHLPKRVRALIEHLAARTRGRYVIPCREGG